MIKPLSLFLLCALTFPAHAQSSLPGPPQIISSPIPTTMPYGQIDIADLQMKQCDFEPDANAEILFDQGIMGINGAKSMKRHVRIKIFNDFGKSYGTVRLRYRTEFLGGKDYSNIEAETINLDGDEIIKIPIDRSQIYTEKLDKNFSEIIFTLPGVKAGSVIEYKYSTYPDRTWYFQSNLPERYSELTINFWSRFGVNGNLLFLKQPLFKDSVDKKHYIKILALNNVRSLPNEPFMTPRTDNLQRLKFGADIFLGRGGWGWARIASSYLTLKDYNFPQESILTGQDAIINKTISVVADEKTIAFVFDTIKNIMKWNGKISSVPSAGLRDTWQKKTGNSTDINLILLHFLRAAGVSAFPTLVATKNFGTIRYGDPDPYIINNTVITIPIDSNKNYYVLDASNKYSLYTDVPVSVLNTYGVMIDPDKMYERLIMLAGKTPARQITTIDADVQRDGKMTATVSITSSSYHKSELLRLFNKLDQKTYLDSAFAAGNKIKVNSFKIDSVKDNNELLSQEISFTTDLNSGNDKYLYLNTTLFSRIGDNPFKNEHRFCDIDLLFNTDYGLNGVYKIPEGYKIDALPKSITLIMTDRSIVFKRTVNFDNGSISVRYSIQNGKSAYKAEEYPSLRDFYKKMYELLNEQIVLKKQ